MKNFGAVGLEQIEGIVKSKYPAHLGVSGGGYFFLWAYGEFVATTAIAIGTMNIPNDLSTVS